MAYIQELPLEHSWGPGSVPNSTGIFLLSSSSELLEQVQWAEGLSKVGLREVKPKVTQQAKGRAQVGKA